MFSDQEAKELIEIAKKLRTTDLFFFPDHGTEKKLDVDSIDGKHKFIVDVNRKGRISLSKCTYQKRYRQIPLIRLDIEGRPHTNPDGSAIRGHHLHIYREGFGVSWAYPIRDEEFSNPKDLILTLREFLVYCNVINASDLPIQGGVFSGT